MKDLIERLENDIAFAGNGPVVVRARDLRALIAAHKALREAARALVAELESTSGDWPRFCDAPRCKNLALVDDGDMIACGEHQGILVAGDVVDLSYAAPLRALRAALKEEP